MYEIAAHRPVSKAFGNFMRIKLSILTCSFFIVVGISDILPIKMRKEIFFFLKKWKSDYISLFISGYIP